MPSTIDSILAAAGLNPAGVVSWGTTVGIDAPGVYVIALTAHTSSTDAGLETCPIDAGAIEEVLNARPELTVDGQRPSAAALAERLAAFWLPDEVVLYIGLAGTSLAKRVGQYYVTAAVVHSVPHQKPLGLKPLRVSSHPSFAYPHRLRHSLYARHPDSRQPVQDQISISHPQTRPSLIASTSHPTVPAPPLTSSSPGQAPRLPALVKGRESRRADPGFPHRDGAGRARKCPRRGHFADFADTLRTPDMAASIDPGRHDVSHEVPQRS